MVNLNPQIFREYDIRGVVASDLSPEFAYLLGRSYAALANQRKCNNIAVGYDARHSSRSYCAELCRGLNDGGIDCCVLGLGPTPQVYWALAKLGFGGCIQVTGSHNPPDMNGFKMCLGKTTLSGADIQELYRLANQINADPKQGLAAKKGQLSEREIREEYIQDLVENCKAHMGPRKLKVVVDAGNGVAGLIGPEVLRRLGVETIELYCEPDGDFPNHHPDPTVLENLHDLISAVKKHKADIGIGWDGDGDRIGAVDQNGSVIFGDMLLLIYARAIMEEKPGASIIADVKCSSRLFADVAKRGGKPLMYKTGHSLMKNKLKEINGDLAGEMSGHIFFNHRFYGFDDASYCSARLVEILSNTSKKASELLADLPPAVATPEIRVDCPEEIKFKIPEAAKSVFGEYEVSTIDGVRINFPEGWGLIRASNTQPVLVLRFEASNQAKLDQYQQLVTSKIEEIKKSLN